MRIAVVGTTGSGKTTLAARLATAMGAPLVELDSLNWQAGWHGLHEHDPEAFASAVRGALAAESWVCDGAYSQVRRHVLERATHLVWLDFPRRVVMGRVIARSLDRSFFRRSLCGREIASLGAVGWTQATPFDGLGRRGSAIG